MPVGMLAQRIDVAVHEGADVVLANLPWMTWNLVLAAVPAALAITLFRRGVERTMLWWAGVVAFVAFLPNAPYVLTDVIHFVGNVRDTESDSAVVFVLIPHYALFMFCGLAAYVVALMRVRSWLQVEGYGRWSWSAEVALHGLCAVGIYLGRFVRLNSWDLVTQPDAVARTVSDSLARRFPIVVIAMTFVLLVAVAPLLRWILTLMREGFAARARSSNPPPGIA